MATAQLKAIQQELREKAKPENVEFFRKMVPGKQKIYGVKMPAINAIAKQYKQYGFELAEELWDSGALEEKIIAVKMLETTGKKDPEKLLKLFQHFAKGIDNWAVCDAAGMQMLRSIVKTHREDIFNIANKFNTSTDPWKRRLSLVMVEWYTREPGAHPEIKKLVKALENDKEYYVKKSVEWIKRNFDKRK
jgi:3-methyladenine DNA glycosylase AlkD